MAAVAKSRLSGSPTGGRNIKVVAVASPGTAIHTAVAGTTSGTYSKIWLYAVNTDTVPRLLTIQFGGTTAPDDSWPILLPPNIPTLVIPGFVLQNGLAVLAFAAAANVVMINGEVDEGTA